jgi:uncharacterized protein YjbJ (UPF0337 family)
LSGLGALAVDDRGRGARFSAFEAKGDLHKAVGDMKDKAKRAYRE